VRVELPVEEVFGRCYVKRIAEDRRSTMRCGTQLYNLWTEQDRPVVQVLCPVIQSNPNAHPAHLEFLARSHAALQPRQGHGVSRRVFLYKVTATKALVACRRGFVSMFDAALTEPYLKTGSASGS
jgi:hypothetical protein